MIHELKILPEYYDDVISGDKNFELRKNDRDYETGDTLKLMEHDDGSYTGRECSVEITYTLSGCPEYGLKKGYIILGIK
jgi:hypothetical protein